VFVILTCVAGVGFVWSLLAYLQRRKNICSQRSTSLEHLVLNSGEWIWEVDSNGFFTYSNGAVKNILGYEPGEIIGKHYCDFCPPQEKESFVKKTRELFAKNASFSRVVKKYLRRGGVEIFIESTGTPLYDKEKNVIGFAGIDRDITEHKKVESAFQESRDYLYKIINSIADPIFVKDRAHRWLLLNDAHEQMFGISTQEMLGKTDRDYFSKVQADVFWAKDEAVFETGKENINEELWTNSKGVTHTIVTKKTLYIDKKGNKFIVGIIRDITDLKKVEEKLKKAMEARSRFTSVVSHELRTPLAAMKTGVNLVLDGLAGSINEEQREFLDIVRRNLDRLARLINDVLDFQRLDSGKMYFKMEPVDIGEILHETYAAMRGLVEKKGLEFKLVIEGKLPRCSCDKDRVIQVLTNLINNAVAFTYKGAIEIIAGQENNHIHIQVRDTGIGIDKEDLSRIFNPFEQVERERSTRREGTGLGLAICREIVSKHNGKIWAASQSGQGSTFHVVVPLSQEG
jgi:PAS domain S-box-containing protein